jgi:hypothetical protein
MGLTDLIAYFQLYSDLKNAGRDMLLNEELLSKEKEYVNKVITVSGVVNEIDFRKNEIIISYVDRGDSEQPFRKLISRHFFVFAISGDMKMLLNGTDLEKDDLVELTGTISSLHRQSAIRIILSSATIIEKRYGIIKSKNRKGWFFRFGRSRLN